MFIKNIRIINPINNEDFISNIFIEGNLIKYIGDDCFSHEKYIDGSGLIIGPSFFDPHVHFRDFNESDKETFESGSLAAIKGGYTHVVTMANTKPAMDNLDMLNLAKEKIKNLPIDILLTCNITQNMEGKTCVNFKELYENGARGFTDDGKPILDPEIMIKALEVSKIYDTPISLHEENPDFIKYSGYNETAPREAEIDIINRDINLLKEYGGSIHVQHLTSKEGVQIIREAKAENLKITTEVTPNHLFYTEEDVEKYGTLLKINPPIRTEADKNALIDGLFDGTIDMIGTDHAPHTEANKSMGKYESMSGIISLETCYSMVQMVLSRDTRFSYNHLFKIMSLNPAKLYGIKKDVSVGNIADLVIIDPNYSYKYLTTNSKSKNTPLLGSELKGKVLMTIKSGEVVYSDMKGR